MPLHISLWVFGIVQSHTFWLLWYWILLAKEHPLRHIWGYNYTWMKEGEVNAQIPLMLSKYHSIKKKNDFDIKKNMPHVSDPGSCFLKNQRPKVPRTHKRLRRMLFNQTKEDKMWILKEILFFKATNNTKTNHKSFCRQLRVKVKLTSGVRFGK